MSSWRTRLASRLLGVRPEALRALAQPTLGKAITSGMHLPEWQAGQPVFSPWSTAKAIDEGYIATAALYACIEIISDAAASVPLLVYKHGVEQEWEPYTDHPLQSLLDKPNPFMSREALVKRLVMHLLLGGNGILTKMRFKTGPYRGAPAELWPIMPDQIKPVPHRTKFISHYVWKAHGEERRIDAADVLHFMQVDPGNPYWGVGSVQAIALAVDTDRAAQMFQRVGMANRGVVDGVLGFKMPLSVEQFEHARDTIDKGISGIENARKILVLGNDASYTKLGLTAEEMDFVASRKFTREEILQGMRVPPPMAGVYDDATLANIETSRKIFWLDRMIPMLTGIASVINQMLVPDFGESLEDIWVGFDTTSVDALQENLTQKVSAFKDLVASRVRPDVAARVVGLDIAAEDIEGGVEVVAPAVVPKAKGAIARPRWTPQLKDAHWYAHDAQRRAWEEYFAEHLMLQFLREGERLIERARAGYDAEDILIAIDEDEWQDLLIMMYRSAGVAFAEQTYASFGLKAASEGTKANPSPFARLTSEVDDYAKFVTANQVRHITDTTRQTLNNTIRKTVLAEGSPDDVARAIRGEVEDMSVRRSWTIARTEMGTIANFGSRKAADDAAIQMHAKAKKLWVTARDGRERDSHAKNEDHGAIDLYSPWPNGLIYPGDPSGPAHEVIQCRCVEVYEFHEMADQGTIDQAAQQQSVATATPDPVVQKPKPPKTPMLSPASPGPPQGPANFNPVGVNDANAKLSEVFSASRLKRALTPDELKSVRYYTGNGYKTLNKSLRATGRPHSRGVAHVQRLDTVLSRPDAATPVDVTLYRGSVVPQLPKDPTKMVGAIMTDPAYLSTSISDRTAQGFLGATKPGKSAIRLKIQAPAGTRGMYVDPISSMQGEREFLLPRGTQLRVLDAQIVQEMRGGQLRDVYEVVASVIQ